MPGVRGADSRQWKTRVYLGVRRPRPQPLGIQGSGSTDATTAHPLCAESFTSEKNPRVSGPTRFKPVLFKGELCVNSEEP